MSGLQKDVRYIKGIGEARAKTLSKVGITTLEELLNYFPRAYEDRSAIKNISALTLNESVCVKAMAATDAHLSHIRKGMDIVKLRAVDDTGGIEITFFNRAYLKNTIKKGETYYFYGKVTGSPGRFAMTNPDFESAEKPGSVTRLIVPIYPLTAGLTQNILSLAIKNGLESCQDELPEILPPGIAEEYHLARPRFAYKNIHFPESEESLQIARKRLIFEEFFVFSAAVETMRNGSTDRKCTPMTPFGISEFEALLPFTPTQAQSRAISDTFSDMTKDAAMSRLIQGDVGSGKTVVAAAACWLAWKNGHQSAFMAPTEILAEQHFRYLQKLFESTGIRLCLLTGALSAKAKRTLLSEIETGAVDIIIGTHALISDGVRFSDLALAVTDEQHRFGVKQRSVLSEKSVTPHVLVMSATPIPRTLALILYGDLDVSIIDELPPGRQKVDTFAVTESKRERVYGFMRKLIDEGRQVFVVCPMVSDSEEIGEDLKSATDHASELRENIFPDKKVALIHGKMKPKEKDEIMHSFASGDADILVATTVIEVGVDVPNAALIVIENAERFGLSQLHQLRGRVGRGSHKSYCIMFNHGGETARERLRTMCETNDGFRIAEADLALRGPGDFLGVRQHGLPEMRIGDMKEDMDIMQDAQKAAKAVLSSDASLMKPENARLSEHIKALVAEKSTTLN